MNYLFTLVYLAFLTCSTAESTMWGVRLALPTTGALAAIRPSPARATQTPTAVPQAGATPNFRGSPTRAPTPATRSSTDSAAVFPSASPSTTSTSGKAPMTAPSSVVPTASPSPQPATTPRPTSSASPTPSPTSFPSLMASVVTVPPDEEGADSYSLEFDLDSSEVDPNGVQENPRMFWSLEVRVDLSWTCPRLWCLKMTGDLYSLNSGPLNCCLLASSARCGFMRLRTECTSKSFWNTRVVMRPP
jgi:hypothetical protein